MQISVWEQESFFAPHDVIIIGAGLTGLWCAYELMQQDASLKILLLEQGMIPVGASTRNAGFACFGSPTELLHDAATIGEDSMLQIAEMRYKGMEKIRRVLGDKSIDYDDCGGYECLQKNLHNIEKFEDELTWLNKALQKITGTDKTFTRASEKLAAFGFEGFDALIENKLEGSLHSGKLVQALTKKVLSLGAEIISGITVKDWNENTFITLFTHENIALQCDRLIICSNAFTSKLVGDIHIEPARGQIILTAPIEDLNWKGTFHFDEGFYYFRNLGKRVLLGGARNKAFEEERSWERITSEVVQAELMRFLSEHILPGKKYTIENSWSGIMGFTEDKKPVCKKTGKHIVAVVACNGMGVALSPMIAEQVKELF